MRGATLCLWDKTRPAAAAALPRNRSTLSAILTSGFCKGTSSVRDRITGSSAAALGGPSSRCQTPQRSPLPAPSPPPGTDTGTFTSLSSTRRYSSRCRCAQCTCGRRLQSAIAQPHRAAPLPRRRGLPVRLRAEVCGRGGALGARARRARHLRGALSWGTCDGGSWGGLCTVGSDPCVRVSVLLRALSRP